MVKLIAGKKGTGKTKRMIKMANEKAKTTIGNIIFIDDDNRHMYDLVHDLRFINMEEYPIKTYQEFSGFLCGIISNDYDVETIYIDGLLKVMDITVNEIEELFEKFHTLSEKYDFEMITSVSANKDELPSGLEKYILK